ncbi:Supervillin [Danaus plexippus plexippus]|uniref:Supervillin n=1 Tax=Danaus plexippus plexippus TaxID=278856 RepID=A0A212F2B9_DANPL|nr:Supervillin [Danaus plexippus plexippus]
MFYGVIIAFGAFIYVVWKYFFAKSLDTNLSPDGGFTKETIKEEVLQQRSIFCHDEIISSQCHDEADRVFDPETDISDNIKNLLVNSNKGDFEKDILGENKNENKGQNVETTSKDPGSEIQTFHGPTTISEIENVDNELLTPSIILRQRNLNKTNAKLMKRNSPPKERFAEYLEKTVLNDDKLQSIIQNLALNECPAKLEKVETEPQIKENSPFSERTMRLQDTIDDIADRIKHLGEKLTDNNESNIDQNTNEHNAECEQKVSDNSEHRKPLLLRRLKTQSALPSGLNFGSVIGELKNKTRNGNGLKPESLNAAVDEKKKVQIDENELGNNILADRRNKLETAAQGWRKRVPQNDASLFTVAGRLERDKVNTTTPPLTPPPVTTPPVSSPAITPAIPAPNRFRSRKAPTSPTNGFASGPLRSASCAVMSAAEKPKETPKIDRESFKRSHSVSESISRVDENEESIGLEKKGCSVIVPRADDETFQAFFAPALQQQDKTSAVDVDIDLDAIDSASRQM